MARRAENRENLLLEATALEPRVQLRLNQDAMTEVFVGFRGSAASFYFEADPVYHFNSAAQLRRAFVRGRLLKAERGHLLEWTPCRMPDAVKMMSRQLVPEEETQFAQELTRRLEALRRALEFGRFQVDGEVPPGSGAVGLVREWLQVFPGFAIARSPRIAT